MICANCGCSAGDSEHVNPNTGGTWCESCYSELIGRPVAQILDSAEDLIERF